ncbi:MAG: hypothetical protein PHT60_01175 [Acidiphilium sp.]|nr:hypothetical protein [Acidiphilium sp.]MDD4934368.1 hypothetical protein [Acidiphilium sp.]
MSATTKFMWFLKPDNWTVFDRFAANGLGIPQANPQARMPNFYKAIISAGIPLIWTEMQDFIQNSDLPSIPAPRIFDQFLMERGRAPNDNSLNESAQEKLNELERTQAEKIHRLALTLQDRFGKNLNEATPSPLPPANPRRPPQHRGHPAAIAI